LLLLCAGLNLTPLHSSLVPSHAPLLNEFGCSGVFGHREKAVAVLSFALLVKLLEGSFLFSGQLLVLSPLRDIELLTILHEYYIMHHARCQPHFGALLEVN
jgi:hypothetical protein